MDRAMVNLIRELSSVTNREPMVLLISPGYYACPLAVSRGRGVTSCPLGFDQGRLSPDDAPLWMQEQLRDVLPYCQECRGKPKSSIMQADMWVTVLDFLTKEV